MQPLGDPRAHFWRVIKMAKATDVDLSSALDGGRIDVPAYTEMIHRCRGCAAVGACDRLLAAQPQLDAAPGYCENAHRFGRLRASGAGQLAH